MQLVIEIPWKLRANFIYPWRAGYQRGALAWAYRRWIIHEPYGCGTTQHRVGRHLRAVRDANKMQAICGTHISLLFGILPERYSIIVGLQFEKMDVAGTAVAEYFPPGGDEGSKWNIPQRQRRAFDLAESLMRARQAAGKMPRTLLIQTGLTMDAYQDRGPIRIYTDWSNPDVAYSATWVGHPVTPTRHDLPMRSTR